MKTLLYFAAIPFMLAFAIIAYVATYGKPHTITMMKHVPLHGWLCCRTEESKKA